MSEVDCITLAIAGNSFGRGFGKRKLKILIDEIPDLLVKKPRLQDLLNVRGVERKTAQHFFRYSLCNVHYMFYGHPLPELRVPTAYLLVPSPYLK